VTSSLCFTTYQRSSCTCCSHRVARVGSYSLRDMSSFFPSSCQLQPLNQTAREFQCLRERYTYARRFTCRFWLSQRFLKQWRIIRFLKSNYPKGRSPIES